MTLIHHIRNFINCGCRSRQQCQHQYQVCSNDFSPTDEPKMRLKHSTSYGAFFNPKVLIFFLLLHKNIRCWYSLEAPHRGASNEYPQYMFSWRNKKLFTGYPPLSRPMQKGTSYQGSCLDLVCVPFFSQGINLTGQLSYLGLHVVNFSPHCNKQGYILDTPIKQVLWDFYVNITNRIQCI